jgi:uncharacterized membrane protein
MKYFVSLISILVFAAVSLAQESAGRLAGRVVDERGKGIAGARVHAETDVGTSEATSNEKGVFELAVAPGTYRLTVSAEGYGEVELPDPLTVVAGKRTRVKEKIELRETDQGSVVRGSVFSDQGRSLAGVKVVLEREGTDARPTKQEARTDATGIFAFKVPKGVGRYRVIASREGFSSATKSVEVGGGEITNIAITLSADPSHP